MLHIIGDRRVYLVRDDEKIARYGERRDLFQRRPADGRPGRIRGIVEQDGLGLCGNQRLEFLKVYFKIIGRGSRKDHRHSADQRHVRGVGHIARLDKDDLVAGIDDAAQSDIEPLADAHGDDDVSIGIVVGVIFTLDIFSDETAELRQPAVGSVMRAAVPDGVNAGIGNPPRGDKIRLTHAERYAVRRGVHDVEKFPDSRRGDCPYFLRKKRFRIVFFHE